MGLVAPWQVGSSQTRDRTGVHCVARQSLNHWTTREAHTSTLTSGGEAGSQIKTKQYNNGDDTFNSISYVSPGHRLTVHGVLPAEEKAYKQDRQITNKVTIPVIKVCCPQSLLKFISTELVILSNHLIFCCALFLFPSIFPRTRIFFS